MCQCSGTELQARQKCIKKQAEINLSGRFFSFEPYVLDRAFLRHNMWPMPRFIKQLVRTIEAATFQIRVI